MPRQPGRPEPIAFTPVILDRPVAAQDPATLKAPASAAPIEVEIHGAVVRVRGNADPRTLAAVIRVLQSLR